MVIVVFFLPLKRVRGGVIEKMKKVDYYGCLLTLAWATLILVPLSYGGTMYAWSSAAVLAPLILGFAILGAFLYVEWKLVPLPIIPLYIFDNGTVNGAMTISLLSGVVFYSNLYYLPQYFQGKSG